MNHPWMYNEFQHVGTDYANSAEVAVYDEDMAQFRDVVAEAKKLIDFLKLNQQQTLVELGTGTGAFALEAASSVKHVFAVDIAQPMLDLAQKKAADHGISNITFTQAGFLSYQHAGQPIDVIVTNAALHHLPDAWKFVALKRLHSMLKLGGVLYLGDVVFAFPVEQFAAQAQQWIADMGENVHAKFADQAANHIREEYSTFDWVLEEMFRRVGFSVDIVSKSPMFATYLCQKSEV